MDFSDNERRVKRAKTVCRPRSHFETSHSLFTERLSQMLPSATSCPTIRRLKTVGCGPERAGGRFSRRTSNPGDNFGSEVRSLLKGFGVSGKQELVLTYLASVCEDNYNGDQTLNVVALQFAPWREYTMSLKVD